MKLGVAMPYWLDRPVLEAVAIGETAERLGFGSLWVGEMMTFDAFALAAAVARVTTRITLTVGPLPVGVRDPAALALGVSGARRSRRVGTRSAGPGGRGRRSRRHRARTRRSPGRRGGASG
jgi:hypothetical protein